MAEDGRPPVGRGEREHLFLVTTGASLPHSKSKSMTFSRLPSVVNAKEQATGGQVLKKAHRSLSYNYYYPKVGSQTHVLTAYRWKKLWRQTQQLVSPPILAPSF